MTGFVLAGLYLAASAHAPTAAATVTPLPAPAAASWFAPADRVQDQLWSDLEDARILVNEDPAAYIPRLRAALDALSGRSVKARVAAGDQPRTQTQRQRARLTLARALAGLGEDDAAMDELREALRENLGAPLDLAAMGPTLGSFESRLPTERALAPLVSCGDTPCVVLLEGRWFRPDELGPLSLPHGRYDYIIVDAATREVLAQEPFELPAPATGPDAATSRPMFTLSTFDVDDCPPTSTVSRRGADEARRAAASARTGAIVLGVLGGVLATTGAALVGTNAGCDASAGCGVDGGTLAGWGALGASLPMISGAVVLGLHGRRHAASTANATREENTPVPVDARCEDAPENAGER